MDLMKDCEDAYLYLRVKSDKLEEEKRTKLIKLTIMNTDLAVKFLANKYFNNQKEFNLAFKRAIKGTDEQLPDILNLQEYLDEDKIKQIVESCIEHYRTSYILFKEYNEYVNKDSRIKAIESILCSIKYTRKLITNCKLTPEERIMIADYYSNEEEILFPLIKRADCRKCEQICQECRTSVFNAVIQHPDLTYSLAIDKVLKPIELKRAHLAYSKQYFRKAKKNAKTLLEYCIIFKKHISNEEITYLINKIITNFEKENTEKVLKSFSKVLDEKQVDELYASLVMEKLNNTVTMVAN